MPGQGAQGLTTRRLSSFRTVEVCGAAQLGSDAAPALRIDGRGIVAWGLHTMLIALMIGSVTCIKSGRSPAPEV